MHLITLIDETTTAECRQEVAVNLVKLFLGQGLAKEFLDLLFRLELDKTGKDSGHEMDMRARPLHGSGLCAPGLSCFQGMGEQVVARTKNRQLLIEL